MTAERITPNDPALASVLEQVEWDKAEKLLSFVQAIEGTISNATITYVAAHMMAWALAGDSNDKKGQVSVVFMRLLRALTRAVEEGKDAVTTTH